MLCNCNVTKYCSVGISCSFSSERLSFIINNTRVRTFPLVVRSTCCVLFFSFHIKIIPILSVIRISFRNSITFLQSLFTCCMLFSSSSYFCIIFYLCFLSLFVVV
uniref:Uncharacterized protein n=1 Tax=Cacopsylla melanoneura TaxID=428564 RepID=A0A8D8RNT9_9HEMI